MATLTLRELERWLTLAIGGYHGSVHGSLLQPPAAVWADAVSRSGMPAIVTHATAFLVDFLPVIQRTLTRTGFVIDHTTTMPTRLSHGSPGATACRLS